MYIGIFGGSFDPIHYGHLILAEQCLRQIPLDEVWFVPAATAPHKEKGATMTDRQRSDTIKLAISGHPQFVFCDLEVERGGVSYTVDTLEQIRVERPDDELFLLMGEDSLKNFSTWRDPKRICELAVPVVVGRPAAEDCDEPDLSLLESQMTPDRYAEACSYGVKSPLIEISSNDIRRRFATGRSARYLLPRGVEKLIETAGIYKTKSG